MPHNNATAEEIFINHHSAIMQMAKRLTDHAENHFGVNSDCITYGDAADAGRVER